MAITIVSPPSISPQPGASDSLIANGSNDSSADLSFLGLLLAQLTPAAPLALDPFAAAGKKIQSALTTEDTTGFAVTDGTASDASTLLATMGLIQAQTPADAANQSTAEPELGVIAGNDGKSGKGPLVATPLSDVESGSTAPLSSEMPSTNDKAAKFAVSSPQASTASETLSVRSHTDNAAASAPFLPPSVATANANQASPSRETALPISTPVRDGNWSGDFGQKIVWLATNDKQTAQLTLNPPQMGPIEVSISVDKGHASVNFVSANAEVRQAIESALPRLREMLASTGIELGQTNVGAESFRQSGGNENGQGQGHASRAHPDNAILASNVGETFIAPRAISSQQGNGLVDIFA